ncbi:MAG TPA: acyl carrier protein [Bryobacteraceae bacterium]|jgi:acyl carrier protein|nr:acyl carrier protein [Bryobacteraceae bacterium]
MPTEPANDDLAPNDLAPKVIRIIAEKQRIPLETVTLDSTFEELKIDSLDGINIIFAVEEQFDISVPDEGVHSIRSVRDMVDGVRSLIEAKAASRAAKSE